MRYYDYCPSPIGDIYIVVNEDGQLSEVHTCTARDRHLPSDGTERCSHRTALVAQQLGEYFRNERTVFDLVLQPEGTSFQHEIWKVLNDIPFGQTRTYGEIAEQLGLRNGARAVGRANATNPISIVVPCHRVIGASGDLTGYAGGLDVKRWLLHFESHGIQAALDL